MHAWLLASCRLPSALGSRLGADGLDREGRWTDLFPHSISSEFVSFSEVHESIIIRRLSLEYQ